MVLLSHKISLSPELDLSLLLFELGPHKVERMRNSWVPDVGHFGISGIIRMNTVAEIGSRESGVLVDDPDGRISAVLGCRPCRDGFVQVLDLGVGAADTDRNDLSNLVKSECVDMKWSK